MDCPIFSKYEERIKKLNQSIQSAKIISKKVDEALELLNLVETILPCPKYDKEEEICVKCQSILNLCKETSNMIIKVNKTYS